MAAAITGILAAGLLALLASLALLIGFGFERFVGTRYLRRETASRMVRLGPYVALAITLLDLLVILATRDHHRTLETFAVVIALVALLATILFLLLRLLSVFTTSRPWA